MALTPLATVPQFAAWLKTTIDPSDASALLYLDIASGMVRDYLQQDISQVVGDVVILDPLPDATLLLPELPVTAVTLVEYLDPSSVTPVWVTADPSTYTASKRMGVISGNRFQGISWPGVPESWRVTYTHGYATIPSSILAAVLGATSRAWNSEDGIDSERIGGYQVKYAMESAGFSPMETLGLARYKVARVA